MSTELSKTKTSLTVAPDFLENEQNLGVEGIKNYIRPPRLKTIQPQSKAPFSEQFNKGDIVLLPQMELVFPIPTNDKGKPQDKGKPFHFVPVFFFPEWCVWNPIQMQGTLPAVRSRTFDENSDIARRAKIKDLWFAKCPENPEYNIRFCEHLNFIMVLKSETQLGNAPVVVSFSRGNYRDGSTLLSLIQVRNKSIFDCQFEAKASLRRNEKGEWYGWDVSNPSVESGVSPWIPDMETHERFKAMFLEYQEAHKNAAIIVEHDDVEQEPGEF